MWTQIALDEYRMALLIHAGIVKRVTRCGKCPYFTYESVCKYGTGGTLVRWNSMSQGCELPYWR